MRATSGVHPQINAKPLKTAAQGPTKLTKYCGLISQVAPKVVSKNNKADIKKREK